MHGREAIFPIELQIPKYPMERIRTLFYSSIIYQDIEFFDDTSTDDITTRVSDDISILQEGMSEKIGFIIQQFTCSYKMLCSYSSNSPPCTFIKDLENVDTINIEENCGYTFKNKILISGTSNLFKSLTLHHQHQRLKFLRY
nr:5870_t:CDS:2 [Entrophospora candida]